jgi:HNH endonuclease
VGTWGGLGPLEPEACRRLACDGAVTRVLVTRHPTDQQPTGQPNDQTSGQQPPSQLDSHQHPTGQPSGPDDGTADPDGQDDRPGPPGDQPHPGCGPSPQAGPAAHDPSGTVAPGGLAPQLRAVMARLPPTLGGAPTQPLDVGRATRVIQPAQRTALAVRDGGCVFPGCARPLSWCEAHHLWHWLDGGPTDLTNLALLCRAHHRAVHEGGWHLARGPDGRVTATPPYRRHPSARRHPPAA